jgi:hypothetical protein
MPPTAKSVEELFPLIEFCKAGNLPAVSNWITQGNPLDPPPGKKTRRLTPLQVAIEKGFLTLTEILLNAGADPMANGNALTHAINHKRADIISLLLDRGTPVDSCIFSWACSTGDPNTIRVFLERGADPIKDFPFYHAFTCCLKPLLGVYKTYVEKFPDLQIQADMALCHYAKEGNLRCVSLLMWAGARPDKEVPDAQEPDRDYQDACALVQAARAGHLGVLKRMKPENYPDLFPSLVEDCWHHNSKEVLEYIRETGIPMNLEGERGSRALEGVLGQLGWDTDPSSPFGSGDALRIDGTIERLEYLIEKGAKWTPNPEYGLRHSRDKFRKLEPEKTLRLFALFKQHQVVSDQFMEDLVNTAGMRAHLGQKYVKAIHELFHPPEIKADAQKASPVPSIAFPPVKLTLPQLKVKAVGFFWEMLRNIPSVDFWREEFWQDAGTRNFERYLGIEKDSQHPLYEIAQAAIEKINQQTQCFELTLDGNQYQQSISMLTVRMKPGCDWRKMAEEAWSLVENPKPKLLTTPALNLFSWLKESGFPPEWMKDSTLSWKAGLRGKRGVLGDYLRELRQKLGNGFCFDSRGHKWGDVLEYRIWIEGAVSLDEPTPRHEPPKSLNPIVDVSLEHCDKKDFDHWRDFIHGYLRKIHPTTKTPVRLIWIETRQEMNRVFPKLRVERYGPGSELAEFWKQIPLHPEIAVAYDFRDTAGAWFVNLLPKTNWEITIATLEELAKQPTLQERFGLSSEAAKLMEWIESLKPEAFKGKWTPIVEEEQEKRIGLNCPWNKENFSSYLQLLLEEINEKTGYDLTLQPWREYSDWKTRIRVAKKKSEESQLVRQLQLYGLEKGKHLDEPKVREMLAKLIGP